MIDRFHIMLKDLAVLQMVCKLEIQMDAIDRKEAFVRRVNRAN